MEHATTPAKAPEVAPVAAPGAQRDTVVPTGPSASRNPMSAKALIGLQRTAGNTAVNAMLRRPRMVQRDGPPLASMPPANSSQTPKAPDAEVMYFEGQALRFDGEVLYGILSKMAERKGVDAPAEFTGRFGNAPLSILKGTERAGLREDIRTGLRDTNLRLDHERDAYCAKFEPIAIEAAQGLLDDSKKKITAELPETRYHLGCDGAACWRTRQ